jgi:hypothetical protein
MVVQAVFGLNGAKSAALLQAGKPIPPPVQARSLLDCGSDIIAIAPQVIQKLGLVSFVPAISQTAAGSARVNLYRLSLTISGAAGRAGPVLVLTNLLASELTAPLPNLEALIGMSVLRECLLVLDGPGQQFILGF